MAPAPEDRLWQLISLPAENESVEFKKAEHSFNTKEVRRYCVAIANAGGGSLVLGVTDGYPRSVVGTAAFSGHSSLNQLKLELSRWLHTPVSVHEVQIEGRRVLLFDVPPRPKGRPLEVDGAYLTRVGESVVPMSPDELKQALLEGDPSFLGAIARVELSGTEVVALLDTQKFFDLLGTTYPTTQAGVLQELVNRDLVREDGVGSYSITNMGALVLAKSITSISPELELRVPRLIVYQGRDRTKTTADLEYKEGFAVCFERMVDFIHDSAPRNTVVEETLHEEIRMFPKQAIRELVANAFVHQDFDAGGSTLRIEMFSDRVEISNPGQPAVAVDRFVDQDRARNEALAHLMRRLRVCEQKGSGIDKVLSLVEDHQLPAPLFDSNVTRTRAVLFGHKVFGSMDRDDRVRACYQHCCLSWVKHEPMTNQSLRKRFGLSDKQAATASQIINQAKEADLIRDQDVESRSLRYASYRPHWA